MTIADFVEKSRHRFAAHGTDALGPVVKDFATSALTRIYRRLDPDLGYRIYDRDWDVLLVLDAARADMYFEVASRGRAALSCASASNEWIGKNLAPEYHEEMAQTAYVTANPFSADLDPTEFGLLDELWRTEWDENQGTVPPGPVSDHAIAAARSGEYGRVLVHYMQPHFPFIGSETPLGRMHKEDFGYGVNTENVWSRAATGDLDHRELIEAYRQNHRYIYEHVGRVLENVEGIVAISADHANALGEWGVWGHRPYLPVPAVRTVPWDVYTCADEGTYNPGSVEPAGRNSEDVRDSNDEADGNGVDEAVTERLRRLGYHE